MTTTPQEPGQRPEVVPSSDPAETPETDPIEPDAPQTQEGESGGPIVPD
jgi:hypothetical protein